jgi:hypothetical protein
MSYYTKFMTTKPNCRGYLDEIKHTEEEEGFICMRDEEKINLSGTIDRWQL